MVKELKKSYLVLIDGTEISFNATNTPLSNFYAAAEIDGYYEVNGALVGKNDITEIYFGDSYNEITEVGDGFLNDCLRLTSVNFVENKTH